MAMTTHHAALSGTDPITGQRPTPTPGEIQKKAQEFAGVFYGMMVRVMEEGIESTGGYGEEVTRTIRSAEIGKTIAAQEGDALSQVIETALTRRIHPSNERPPQNAPVTGEAQIAQDHIQAITNKIRQIVAAEKSVASTITAQHMIGRSGL